MPSPRIFLSAVVAAAAVACTALVELPDEGPRPSRTASFHSPRAIWSTASLINADVANSMHERGVTVVIVGDTLTLSWNPSAGLMTSDADDPILSVTYGGLGNVQVQRVGSPSSAATLAALIGVASVTCMM